MDIASAWVETLTKMNPFLSIIALGTLIAIVGLVVDGIRRIYKIHLIHHERMAMIERGMAPGPFLEGPEKTAEDAGETGVSPQDTE